MTSPVPHLFAGNIFSKLLGVQRGSDVPMTQTMLELGEYAAEPAVWVNTWRHQGHLQAMVQGRSLLVSTEDLFKVLQGLCCVGGRRPTPMGG